MSRILILMAAAAFSIIPWTTVCSQKIIASKQPRIISKFDIPGTPVVVSGLRVEGSPVTFCQQFEANDRWMDEIGVTVQNTSTKVITTLSVVLYFRTNAVKNLGTTTLYFKGTLNPGETAELKSRNFFETLTHHLADRGVTLDTSRAQLRVEQAGFFDGTEWLQGSIYNKDPLTGRRELLFAPLRVPNALKWEGDCANVLAARPNWQQPRVIRVMLHNQDQTSVGIKPRGLIHV